MKMKNEKFVSMVQKALQKPAAVVENLGIIGGMTNLNYLVDVDGKSYVVRIPGHGTSSLIDRAREIQNLKLGSALGINPELVYFNIESGMKITETIEDARPLTKEENMNLDLLQKLQQFLEPCIIRKRK